MVEINMRKIAVIDCGTNTFNLAIAQSESALRFNYLYNDRIPVMLGKGGIIDNILQPDAFERGVNALIRFNETIKKHGVNNITALGTAALRDAKNGKDFIAAVKEKTGITVRFIDGIREAELIYTAARYCTQLESDFLVMDIGGGSNEFIIQQNNKADWKKSYRLGVSRLQQLFGTSIESEEGISRLNNYLKEELKELTNECKKRSITTLVGTAGSFDSFANVLHLRKTGKEIDTKIITTQYDFHALHELCIEITSHSQEYCQNLPGIPEYRKEYIKYAASLCLTLFQEIGITTCHYSAYSLKEGLIIEQLLNA